MAKFNERDRVKVNIDPNTPQVFWTRTGIVTYVAGPMEEIGNGPQGMVEQQYRVKLDDAEREDAMLESWLDPE